MNDRIVWVVLNLINVVTTGLAALACRRQWDDAYLLLLEPGPFGSVRQMRERNRDNAAINCCVNFGLFALGGGLILAALGSEGDVPDYVLYGTGFFTVIWIVWAGKEFWDHRRLVRITKTAERERKGIA